jgi:hypothetical protein
MSDRLKLAREIATRTEPRFIEIKPEPSSESESEPHRDSASTWWWESAAHGSRAYSYARRTDG